MLWQEPVCDAFVEITNLTHNSILGKVFRLAAFFINFSSEVLGLKVLNLLSFASDSYYLVIVVCSQSRSLLQDSVSKVAKNVRVSVLRLEPASAIRYKSVFKELALEYPNH